MNGINVGAAAREVVGVLAKHNIPIALIDEVFREAEKLAHESAVILAPKTRE